MFEQPHTRLQDSDNHRHHRIAVGYRCDWFYEIALKEIPLNIGDGGRFRIDESPSRLCLDAAIWCRVAPCFPGSLCAPECAALAPIRLLVEFNGQDSDRRARVAGGKCRPQLGQRSSFDFELRTLR